MILRSALRPQNALQASSRLLARPTIRPSFRRHDHQFPVLKTHGASFRENGIPGFLTPDGYDFCWLQYQGMLVEKLNQLTFGTVNDGIPARQLAIKYAHDASNATLFNYASMAGNNTFFFERLHPTGTQPSSSLMKDINESFGSFDTLRTEIVETADAMFGNGFVWLMKDDKQGQFRLLCTYNAGSPWPEAHYRRQSQDMSNQFTHVGRDAAETERLNTVQNQAGVFGRHSVPSSQGVPPTDALTGGPVLCVNAWQHMYLRDYGVRGKRQYLLNWWERIDWGMVESSTHHYGKEYKSQPGGGYGRQLYRSMNRQ